MDLGAETYHPYPNGETSRRNSNLARARLELVSFWHALSNKVLIAFSGNTDNTVVFMILSVMWPMGGSRRVARYGRS